MYVDASAPTRIDLAGGTMDIWPLYLFYPRAQTLNLALSLRAHCSIAPRADGRIVVRSRDTGRVAEAASWHELPLDGELALLTRLVHHFRASGLELTTWSDSPVGAGIAGSSALNVAVCGALARWTGVELTPDALLQIAMNVEAQVIDVPTGVQDYRPALYGGVAAVELGVDGVHRRPLDVDVAALEQRLVLAYTGASRNSGINNWDIFKRHIDGDATIRAHFNRIRDVSWAMREALEAGDWTAVGSHIADEWRVRKALAPGVTTDAIDALMAGAAEAGALAAKVCGAGGGGCLFCYADPAHVPAIRASLTAGGAHVLDFGIDGDGLRLRTSDQPLD